ncbi:MAG: hypothetical protein IIC21_04605 [Chloroflexi bacterium]|nr:hypothetical protein [Chloroflexota bacterium]
MAEIRTNRAKRKLQQGEVVTAISGPHTSDIIDFLGQFGFDAIWIEAEHGPVDYADIPDMTRACDLWDMTSIVRVNQNVDGVIYRTLDVGAQGVVVPHVNTAAEAKKVVEAARFAPMGLRGNFTSRQGFGVSDYAHKANDEVLTIILIEDIIAVNNLSEILQVDSIDVFFVAPGDLAQTMGHLGNISHPEVQETIDKALAQITAAGRTPGTLVTDATAESYVKKGVKFIYMGWAAWLASGAQAFKAKVDAAAASM